MKRAVRVAAVILLIALLLIATRLALPLIGGYLIVSDPLAVADAILPLAGGRERVVYAARLYDEGYARWFLATDMPLNTPGVWDSYSTLVKREAVWQGVPAESVIQSTETVTTTWREAQAVRRLAGTQGWHAVLVVSSAYHTRRARLIFRDVFRDTGMAVIVHPVEGDWYRADSWWRTQDGLRETWTEYLKLLLHVLGYR